MMKTKGRPDKIDLFVGLKIKEARKQAGYSQEKIGKKIGVTFQQVQKYERGTNRVAAGKLYKIAKEFKKPLTWFFPK